MPKATVRLNNKKKVVELKKLTVRELQERITTAFASEVDASAFTIQIKDKDDCDIETDEAVQEAFEDELTVFFVNLVKSEFACVEWSERRETVNAHIKQMSTKKFCLYRNVHRDKIGASGKQSYREGQVTSLCQFVKSTY
ncbi:hypothetical protein RFI_19816 [Reticulomyxa filosa]|uniref:Uncharacterized protein n=1 Tax=Reticulomyxa filosa TaxID=46433 RepID=X6MV39_RETFI|nr:hypothetical protein RFI_19816 [Reticulomyxa filosa]|eukprot:ETO17506.1 hypothetical protein RFI_19816 [Reticulomyxa filosa]